MFAGKFLENIKEKLSSWDKNAEKYRSKKSLPRFFTISGEDINELYTPLDIKGSDADDYFEKQINFPGEYPYTRGIHPTMYRSKMWTFRQFAGMASPEETNERFKYILAHGGTGLSTAFDLPTLMGYDSDQPQSLGEVGKCGVAVDTLADMEIIFEGIDLGKVSVSMTINSPASIILAMYLAVAEKKGVAFDKLRGTLQNDILKEYIAQKEFIYPPKPSIKLITDMMAYCLKNVPQWNTISISGYHIREAGSTASQEVGFTLANGIAYVEAALNAGLDLDLFALRLSFFFNAHNDLLEEVAKYRAARRLWASIMKERFSAKNPRSMMLRFHTQTAGSTLTAQQVDNNIVRVTIQTLAAVLGGTQSLHTNSKDEALALPTEDSVRIALRTQQIVAEESGVTNTIDPLAGSYYVEAMTDRIEKEAKDYINKIDSLGGMIEAINSGYVQSEIQKAAYKYEKEFESGERVVVGVNKYQSPQEENPDLLKIDMKVQKEQIKLLTKVKAERNNEDVKSKIQELKNAAEGNSNLIPYIIEAVKTYATIGEISNALREVFGEYKEIVTI